MQSVEILDRLKVACGVDSDLSLANRLNIPQGTIAKWRKRGRIPPGGIARIAVAIGRSVEWVRTGTPSRLEMATEAARVAEGMSQYIVRDTEQIRKIEEIAEGLLTSGGVDLLMELAAYIKDAPRQERDTIRRLLRGLKASPEVRSHLIGQLKLIDRLIDAEQPPREDKAADPPARAKAS